MRSLQVLMVLVALGLGSISALAADAPEFKLIAVPDSGHQILQIQNTTSGNLNVFVLMFDGDVVVSKGLTFGVGAAVVHTIEGAGTLWKVTLAGNGLAPKAFLSLSLKPNTALVRSVYGFLVK